MKRLGWLLGAACLLSACGSASIPSAPPVIAGNHNMQMYSYTGDITLSGQLQVTLDGYNAKVLLSDPLHSQLEFSGTRSLQASELDATSGSGICSEKTFPLYTLHQAFQPIGSNRGEGELLEWTCQDGRPIMSRNWQIKLR